ncbi:hypothetical protein SFUMM280S_04095 [Streptomyces fumanus]
MPASQVSAAAIAARLSAAGLPTRMEEHARFTTIEAEVPEALSAESWREALEAVAEADRFGLLATSLGDSRPYGRSYTKRSPRRSKQ